MAFGKMTGFKGMTYQGGGPMLAWYLHRIGGLIMVLFIGTHVLASFLNRELNSNLGVSINKVYEAWYVQAFLGFFIIFHVLNGLRIILLDIWPRYIKYQREITWIEWMVFVPVYGLSLYVMIQHALGGG